MHKSYKYILVFLTTVLIFCTMFSVQKVSANGYLIVNYNMSDLLKENDTGAIKNFNFEIKDNLGYSSLSDYDIQVEFINLPDGVVLEEQYTGGFFHAYSGGENVYRYMFLQNTTSIDLKNTDTQVRFKIPVDYKDSISYVSLLYNSSGNNWKGNIADTKEEIENFLQVIPPLKIQMEELPKVVMMGALEVIPVGLVVLSILLGIVLIPRLINYFRH